MRTAIIVTVSGDTREVDLDGPTGALKIMQDAVGGYIECVALSTDLDMFVNEEGKLIGLEHNSLATHLWEKRFGVGTGTIEGDVILTGGVGSKGETLGLTANVQKLVEKLTSGFVKW